MNAKTATPGPQQPVDVFVIGGGINGCGIARDLVGRGYCVALAEKVDFASGTSSWSAIWIIAGGALLGGLLHLV